MEQKIVNFPAMKIAGKRMIMSFADYRPGDLWSSFMPKKKLIPHVVGIEMYSIKIYEKDFYKNFDANRTFEMWASVEVSEIGDLPEGIEVLELPGGLYSVFSYKGGPEGAPEAFGYIFREWLPASGYQLDDRPHFEILGEKYRRDDVESEEEICIPIYDL
jgi:AraC family transcriptional regulator